LELYNIRMREEEGLGIIYAASTTVIV